VSSGVFLFLITFYAGAVLASTRSWIAAWRGVASFSALRDLTGIGDRAALRRLFGLTLRDGRYRVTLSDVLKHRRRAGMLLTDIPVHLLFLTALILVGEDTASATSAAVAWAAGGHALILGLAALSVLVRSPRVRTG
jgi:hypothetical protein